MAEPTKDNPEQILPEETEHSYNLSGKDYTKLIIVIPLIIALYAIIDSNIRWIFDDVSKFWKSTISIIILISLTIIICPFIVRIINFNSKEIPTENEKKNKLAIWKFKPCKIILLVLIFLAILLLGFQLLLPLWQENIIADKTETESQTAATFLQTGTATISPSVPTNTPTLTPTTSSTPTITSIPTETLIYSNIRIGLIDLGNECLQERIVNKIAELGFNYELIPFDIPPKDLFALDVLYLSDGWSCKIEELGSSYFLTKLDGFLFSGKGILIGNPELVSGNYDFKFPPITIRFEKIDPIQEYFSVDYCAFVEYDCYSHWIIHDLSITDFPYPEVKISFPEGGKPYKLTIGYKSAASSLIRSPGSSTRYVILAGGEFSSTEKTISDELFIRIIEWLAGKAPPDGDLEWYPN